MSAVTAMVVLTPDQLTDLVRGAVVAGVAEALAAPRSAPSTARDRLTVGEAAEALRCSTRQIRRLISSGRLRAAKLASGGSSRLLITARSVQSLLAEDA